MADNPDAETLQAITGLSSEQASVLLEAAGGDLEKAVQLHFEGEDRQSISARDAEVAASLAAEAYEQPRHPRGVGDAAEYGEGYDDEFDCSDDDDDGFPEAVGEGDDQVAPPARGRQARSPEPPAQRRVVGAAAGAPPPYSRWRAVYGFLAAYVPFFGYLERFGGLLYRTGVLSVIGYVLWAPAFLLGFVGGPAARGPPPPAVEFSVWFEEHFGPAHPRLFRGSCQSALSRSRTEAKFLLAYLHDHSEPACREFCQRVLASPLFTTFADENFIVWVGETHTPEGRAVRRALRVTQTPAVVLLAHGDLAAGIGGGGGGGGGMMDGGAPAQALGSVQGERALNEEGLIASLAGQLEAFEPLLVAARAEQNERILDRQLRSEQEEEYLRSLAEDEAKDAAEAAARAAAEAAAAEAAAAEAAAAQEEADEQAAVEARREARLAKAVAVPAEPPAGPNATRLVIKLPDGRRLDRRFDKSATLQAALDYVESEDPDAETAYDLVSNFPRKVFTREQSDETLESLGLHPQAMLFTREAEEE